MASALIKKVMDTSRSGVNGIYSRLINRFLQIDASLSTGYTTSDLPSLISYLGPGNVKGILTGEKSGKSICYANTAALITYINSDWFASGTIILPECGKCHR